MTWNWLTCIEEKNNCRNGEIFWCGLKSTTSKAHAQHHQVLNDAMISEIILYFVPLNQKKNSHVAVFVLSSKDYYFDSYSHFGIHEEMLKDEVRIPPPPRAFYFDTCFVHIFFLHAAHRLRVGRGRGVLSATVGSAVPLWTSSKNKRTQPSTVCDKQSERLLFFHSEVAWFGLQARYVPYISFWQQ